MVSDLQYFEYLVLEAAQAGLSWETILNRREGYRDVFHAFNPKKVAEMSTQDVERALLRTDIIRNKRKVESALSNARVFLSICSEFGSFKDYLENLFLEKEPQLFARILFNDFKKRGMKSFGEITCRAYLQAVGELVEHEPQCFLKCRNTK